MTKVYFTYFWWYYFLIYNNFSFSTFVCPTEIVAFSDRAKDFAGIDCQVIGVSTDSEFSHLAWINTPRKVYQFICLIINVSS